MANFDSATRSKIASVHTASRLIQIIYSVYTQAKSAQALLQLYTGATDPAFNAAVNAMLVPAERTEIGQVLTQINALVNNLETNHASLIAEG
jgi:hypothetical protein